MGTFLRHSVHDGVKIVCGGCVGSDVSECVAGIEEE